MRRRDTGRRFRIRVPQDLDDFCGTRVEAIVHEFVTFDRPLSFLARTSYLQGMADAAAAIDGRVIGGADG